MHSLSIVVAALTVATPALAQQRVDRSRLYPVTAPVRHAGTVDVTTGRWTRPGGAAKIGAQVVYDNTCTWAGGFYYATFDWCEDAYDEGRIPSPSSPNAPAGAVATTTITSMEFGYCTDIGPILYTGGYDIQMAFWDKLGGDCVGGAAPTPPPVSSTAAAYFELAGLGLPGSTAYGFTSCWLVTLDTSNSGFELASDGDGQFDGTSVDDSFVWMIRQNTSSLQPAGPTGDGFFVVGDPSVGGFGACTYDIPCGIDTFTGQPCGTGLDTFDGTWINVDGVGVGSSASAPPGCTNSVAQYGFGSNCYFFGGWPTNPLSSFYLRLDAYGSTGIPYCTQSKATSVAGCTATLDATDLTLAGGVWRATDIARDASAGVGTSLGVFLYTSGVGSGPSTFSASVPFGTLCLTGFKRSSPACAPALLPGALPGQCNVGPMTTAVNCNGGALGLTVGYDVNVQLWYRDPTAANSGNANLSNALFYTLQ